MHDLIIIVVPKVLAEWEDVAYALDYDIQIVRQIRNKYNGNVAKCCKELLEDWLVTNNGATPNTWGTLLDALKEIKELSGVTIKIIEELIQQNPQGCMLLHSYM